jgi:hypothetical protein
MQATHNIRKGKYNTMLGFPNVSPNKFTEKLGIPVRKVADIMIQLSDSGGNVSRLLQITQM